MHYTKDARNYLKATMMIVAKMIHGDSRLSAKITNKKWDDEFGCMGQECCADGTAFNSDTNKCEILNNSGSASETASESASGSASESLNETMISGDLTKYSLNDNNLRHS